MTSWELEGKEKAGVFSVSDATERGKEDGQVKRRFGNSFIRKRLVPTDKYSRQVVVIKIGRQRHQLRAS